MKGDPVAQRSVLLTEYDPSWPELFEQESAIIRVACGSRVRQICHIGSTAISGMLAKPIVDILVTIPSHEDGLGCVIPLRNIGYRYRGANGIEGRHYFTKGDPRTHHLHIYVEGHPAISRHVKFRDYLRSHPDEALAYRELKKELGRHFATDSQSYSRAKEEFCRRIDRLASSDGEPES
jgi:GrpB-like predicted nucleotidyltransferase (UPF0157 family)